MRVLLSVQEESANLFLKIVLLRPYQQMKVAVAKSAISQKTLRHVLSANKRQCHHWSLKYLWRVTWVAETVKSSQIGELAMAAVNQDTDMIQVNWKVILKKAKKKLLTLDTLQFKSDCHCCQASDYRRLYVHVTCTDGHSAETEILVPSGCGCLQCSTSFTPDKSVSKIDSLHHLVQGRLDNNAEVDSPVRNQVILCTVNFIKG